MIHFFWVDERCVPPDNPESNYRMAYLALLSKILIPGRNIHRIKGENLPENEMIRYTNELIKEVPSDHDFLPSTFTLEWVKTDMLLLFFQIKNSS